MLFKEVEKKIKDHDASLADIVNNPAYVNKPLVTFSCDDGYIEDINFVAPLLKTKGWSGVSAIITSFVQATPSEYMSLQQVKDLHNNFGWEIASHTVSSMDLTSEITLNDVENQLKNSKIKLNEWGFDVNTFVYPQGKFTNDIVKVVRKYYKIAPSTKIGVNEPPIDSLALKRVGFGGNDLSGNLLGFDYYKNIIDNAYSNKKWLIFMIHGFNFQGSDANEKKAIFTQIVDYVASLNIEVVTFSKAYESIKNPIEIGNKDTEHFIVGADGNISSTALDNIQSVKGDKTLIKETTPITSFEKGKITSVSYVNADNSGFPTGAGTLITYRLNEDYEGCNFQLWFSFSEFRKIYKRSWDVANNTWLYWVIFDTTDTIAKTIGCSILPKTGVNITTPITSFPAGKLSITSFLVADASGYPISEAGTLLTYRINDNDTLNYQIWFPYGSNIYMKRVWNGSTWNNFGYYTPTYYGTVTLPTTNVPANTCIDIDVAFTNARNNGKSILATPLYGMPNGLLWNVLCKTDNNITIRVFNTTATQQTVQTQWTISLIG